MGRSVILSALFIFIHLTNGQEYGAPGTVKWRYKTGWHVFSLPAIGLDGTIYFGSWDNYLYALTPDGKLKWRYKTRAWVSSSPAIGLDGTIYFGSDDNYLYALTPDGKLKWCYQTGDGVSSSPAIGLDGTIYFGSHDNYLYALTPDGKLKWRYQTGDRVSSSPAIGLDGTIYFGSHDNYLYALTPDGKLKWRYQTGDGVSSSPAIGLDGTIYFGSWDRYLYALTPDGKLKWRYQTGDRVSSSPAIGLDGTIYFGSHDNYLYALTPDGKLKWRYQTGDRVSSSPAIGLDGTIYFGSWDRYLYALTPDGKLKWRYKTRAWVSSSPAIGLDGTIYFGSWDNCLYAIRGEAKGLAKSPWPKFRHDNRNTGCVQTSRPVVNTFRPATPEFIDGEAIDTSVQTSRPVVNTFRPSLDFSYSLYENKNIWVGGQKVGFIITVENRGKGKGDVDIILSGDEYLLKLFGSIRSIGEIEPGKIKSEVFTVDLPTEPPEREAILYIELKEKIWGESPLKKVPIRVALVRAEKPVSETPPEPLYPIPTVFENKRPKGYALIIGLSRYANVPGPKYAKDDAEVFSKYVAKVFGIANPKTLYDEKATVGTIKANLTDWLKQKRGFKVIYFAGHGVPDPENPREGDVYLLPYDGDPELKSTLIGLKEISQLGMNEGDTVLVFLDACFSGGEGRTVQLATRPLVVANITPVTPAITFAAAEGTQPSKEFEKAQHGYFTYYTLLGLKGRADSNGDGWITTTELYNFVKEKVADRTNNLQIPVLRPEREIRIGKIR